MFSKSLKIKYKYWYRHAYLYDLIRKIRHKSELAKWEDKGRLSPPPHIVKQKTVKEYADKYSLHTLVETGTYFGDMIYATRDIFTKIYSIELDPLLNDIARKKFRKFKHIAIIQGDSENILPEVLNQIIEPSLFWLDGHYSGSMTSKTNKNTPIMQELEHILNHPIKNHVILIDDAREFVGQNDYPTIEAVSEFVFSKRSKEEYILEVKNDIIRIHQKLGLKTSY